MPRSPESRAKRAAYMRQRREQFKLDHPDWREIERAARQTPEKIAARKLDRQNNPEKYRERRRRYWELHRDEMNAYQREYKKTHSIPSKTIEGQRAYHAKRRAADPLGYRRHMHGRRIKRMFGVSADQYDEMLAAQGGLCAICRQPETWLGGNREVAWLSVDHARACCADDRSCGKCVRELLCMRCNRFLLGGSRDDAALLRAAADYVERHAARLT